MDYNNLFNVEGKVHTEIIVLIWGILIRGTGGVGHWWL